MMQMSAQLMVLPLQSLRPYLDQLIDKRQVPLNDGLILCLLLRGHPRALVTPLCCRRHCLCRLLLQTPAREYVRACLHSDHSQRAR